MKKLTVILTAALLTISLCSCGTKPAEISASSGVGREPPAEVEPEPELVSYPYQLSRTDPMMEREGVEYPHVVVLRTRSELEQYTSQTEGYYNYDENLENNSTFYDIVTGYDASFFETNSLIMALVFSPCGSYNYRIDGFAETELGYSMEIAQLTHEADTDDIAVWHLIAEVPKDSLILECADQITVNVTSMMEN